MSTTRKKGELAFETKKMFDAKSVKKYSNMESDEELQLDSILNHSTLRDNDPAVQMDNIINAFNQHVPEGQSCFTTSLIAARGQWIDRDEVLLGHRNRTPELAGFVGSRYIARKLTMSPSVTTEITSKHKQTDLFYGAHGSYVLNVPVGKYAKAWSGNTPMIFAPGPHVIHDQNFKFNPQNGLVDQADMLIQHGTLNILRVPSGKIAKVWIGSIPVLLEARREPYVFNNPAFRIEPRTNNDYFFDATTPCITHGSIKRLMPITGEVVVTYNNGQLEVISPKEDGQPTIIDSPNHSVVQPFLNKQTRTLRFSHLHNAKGEEKNNEKLIFRTNDQLRVSVTLVVMFEIRDPKLTLETLGNERNIIDHIENVASIDMGMVVQGCSSSDFLRSKQTKPVLEREKGKEKCDNSAQTYQDEVRDKLAKDLDEIGIRLVRLNFETPQILDPKIAHELEQQAIVSAKANTEQSVLEINTEIAKKRAQQEAGVKAIAQEQVNATIISKAEAELQAAKLRAEAIQIEAKAKKNAAVTIGEQFRENPQLFELELAKLQAEAFSKAQFLPPQMASVLMQGFGGAMPQTLFGSNASQSSAQRGQLVQLTTPEDTPRMKQG